MPAKTYPMRSRQDFEQGSGDLALWRYIPNRIAAAYGRAMAEEYGKEVTMDTNVFCLNAKKNLEVFNVKVFFASITEGKSPHWVDIVRSDSSY